MRAPLLDEEGEVLAGLGGEGDAGAADEDEGSGAVVVVDHGAGGEGGADGAGPLPGPTSVWAGTSQGQKIRLEEEWWVQPMAVLRKTGPLMETLAFSLHAPWYQQAQTSTPRDQLTPYRRPLVTMIIGRGGGEEDEEGHHFGVHGLSNGFRVGDVCTTGGTSSS